MMWIIKILMSWKKKGWRGEKNVHVASRVCCDFIFILFTATKETNTSCISTRHILTSYFLLKTVFKKNELHAFSAELSRFNVRTVCSVSSLQPTAATVAAPIHTYYLLATMLSRVEIETNTHQHIILMRYWCSSTTFSSLANILNHLKKQQQLYLLKIEKK